MNPESLGLSISALGLLLE